MDIKSLADRLAELDDPGGVHRRMRELERIYEPLRAADRAALGMADHVRSAAEQAHLRTLGAMAMERGYPTSALGVLEERMRAEAARGPETTAYAVANVVQREHALAHLRQHSAWEIAQQELSAVSNALRRADGVGAEFARTAAQNSTHSAMLRAASGLAGDLGTYAAAANAKLIGMAEAQYVQSIAQDFARGFRLPGLEEVNRLYADASRGFGTAESLARLVSASEADRAFREMTRPWLNEIDPVRSVRGLVELQGLGALLSGHSPFSIGSSAAYRSVLGDWRDAGLSGSAVVADIEQRAELYRSMGFDGALTDMPADAFAESAKVARVSTGRPALIAVFAQPVETAGDEREEAAFERTNKAYNWLLRFETQLRRFIDKRMRAAFGEKWPRYRLPNGLYERWIEKQSKAGARASEMPLIAFADFTEYLAIIVRRDNWREVFALYFEREEAVRESFQRLYPIRHDTMHARLISTDDELFLYVEVRRIMQAITRH